MALRVIPKTESAYDYPLIIRHLLHTPRQIARDIEIVYRDVKRIKYSEFFERLERLVNALSNLGVRLQSGLFGTIAYERKIQQGKLTRIPGNYC
ncbi:MAG: hypothetical protein JRI45_04075 [Deltaproteobacteria bacterium]|nr:hypothetical protein [Deltaproteobacteria bacterium]MBW2068557.1 hypothetical protein [Deltaproteobacteria bacterium]